MQRYDFEVNNTLGNQGVRSLLVVNNHYTLHYPLNAIDLRTQINND